MYQSILVCNYMICEKTSVGSVPVYNSKGRLIKVIDGVSEEDCKAKTEQFLRENNFLNLKKESV